jgi:hypothetical protein
MPEEEIISKKEKIKVKIITFSLILGGIILIIVFISLGKFAYKAWFGSEASKPVAVNKKTEKVSEVLTKEGDADLDGMPNGWETKYGLDPKNPADALGDPDSDGLTNLQEFMYGTDPKNSDTDKDGYLDGREVEAGYNPAGPGRLEKPLSKSVRLTFLEGTWKGLITGAIYSSNNVTADLISNGKLTGNFTFTIESKKAENSFSGQYDFNDKINGFEAKIESKIILDGNRGQYKLSLNGIVNKDKSEIIGTWTGYPEGTYWLKRDRGTFKLTKMNK